MQTPRFQEQICRPIYRQIFALYGAARRQITGAKPFDINRLPPKIRAIDDVSGTVVKNQQAIDSTEFIIITSDARHSHSIVAGGLPDTSYTTRFKPRTSLMMRLDTLPSRL